MPDVSTWLAASLQTKGGCITPGRDRSSAASRCSISSGAKLRSFPKILAKFGNEFKHVSFRFRSACLDCYAVFDVLSGNEGEIQCSLSHGEIHYCVLKLKIFFFELGGVD